MTVYYERLNEDNPMRYYYHTQMQLKHYIYIYISISAEQPLPRLYYYSQFTAKVQIKAALLLKLMSCIFKRLQASVCLFYSVFYSPSFGKVGPIGHDHSAEHDIVFGEVTGEEIRGADHGNPKNVGHLVAVGRV